MRKHDASPYRTAAVLEAFSRASAEADEAPRPHGALRGLSGDRVPALSASALSWCLRVLRRSQDRRPQRQSGLAQDLARPSPYLDLIRDPRRKGPDAIVISHFAIPDYEQVDLAGTGAFQPKSGST